MSEKSAGDRDDLKADDDDRYIFNENKSASSSPDSSNNNPIVGCPRCFFDWLSSFLFKNGLVEQENENSEPLSASVKITRQRTSIRKTNNNCSSSKLQAPSLPKSAGKISTSSLPLQRVVNFVRLFSTIRSSHYASDAFSPPRDQRRRRRRRLKTTLTIWPFSDDDKQKISCASTSSLTLTWSPPLSRLLSYCSSSSRSNNRTSPKNNTFLQTTFYILSVFLFLSGFLPISVANSSTLLLTKPTPILLFNSSGGLNNNRSNRGGGGGGGGDNASTLVISHRRDISAAAVQSQMPIFRSAEYIFGAAPADNSVFDLPGDEQAGGQPNSQQENSPSVLPPNIAVNSTTVYTNDAPIVWVPYLGVVVIFSVFMVLIVTFWLHIRRSRYRAIQLVKSSPNSEWNEIQPGRWEASYGGHVYTVNQINQTRVLGAIAAATVTAMGQGVRRMTSVSGQPTDVGDSQVQDSSIFNAVGEVEDDERTGLLTSQAERSVSYRGERNSSSASVMATATPTGATINPAGSTRQSAPSVSSTTNMVPVSDSIWLLTEEQLIESIKSSNESHKSTPAPTPTTVTTVTGDGISTSTAGSITSATRRSNVPPPVPPRAYGTFSPPPGQTSPPVPHDTIVKLAMVENNDSSNLNSNPNSNVNNNNEHPRLAASMSTHSKASVHNKSLPGEFAMEPMTTLAHQSGTAKYDQDVNSGDIIMESEDICGDLPLQPMSSFEQNAYGGTTGWSNDSFSSDPGDETTILPSVPLSLDEMTLPEPEPWTPNANTAYAAVPAPRTGPRIPVGQRMSTGSSGSGGQGGQGGSGSGSGSLLGGTNMIQGRRISSVRGSVRGRGRGAAGRGQLSSLIAYSNMSKKKGGFIIPRG